MKNTKGKILQALIIVLVVCGLGLVGVYLYREYSRPPAPAPIVEPVLPPSAPEPEPEPEPQWQADYSEMVFPLDAYKSAATREREEYEDASLLLYAPAMGFEGEIYGGVDEVTLLKGPGLFDYATLPSDAKGHNSNTSIAGHRDVGHSEFYYIDRMEPGDHVYIQYDGKLFTYEVEDSFVTHDRDWDPVRIKDHAVVTLQSCTPIGIASQRIFVVGRLVDVVQGATFEQTPEWQAQHMAREDGGALSPAA